MGKKDKRIKGCPDPGCERHVEHYKYKADDQFCTQCGARLVYVCAKCFEEIEDSEDQRRYCYNCKPEKEKGGTGDPKPPKEKKEKPPKEKKEKPPKEKKEKPPKEKKEKPPKEKKEKPPKEKKEKAPVKGKETVARSVAVIKGKAPQIRDGAIRIATNPKVQRAALEVAEIAKDGIKHKKTRRVIGVLIRAVKK